MFPIEKIKTDVYALILAVRHPRTPWYAKAAAVLTIAYALSPIDIIPDFIPVIGHLDDLVVVPLGVMLVKKLVPEDVMDDCRRRAGEHLGEFQSRARRVKWLAWTVAFLILSLWLLALFLIAVFIYHLIAGK